MLIETLILALQAMQKDGRQYVAVATGDRTLELVGGFLVTKDTVILRAQAVALDHYGQAPTPLTPTP